MSPSMLFDNFGLGFTSAGEGRVRVHYPRTDAAGVRHPGEGGAWAFDVPAEYLTGDVHPHLATRMAVIRQLVEGES